MKKKGIILLLAVVVVGIVIAAVIKNSGSKGTTMGSKGTTMGSKGTAMSSDDTTVGSEGTASSSEEITETGLIPQSVIDNMAAATPVDGIEITDEILEKGILNPGNPARVIKAMQKAAAGEKVTLAYIGGSITQGHKASPQAENCYAYLSMKWWKDTFPDADIEYVNAGIGATDSWLGVHRVQDDVLSKNPDLVVVEFSVNDTYPHNQETYDSLIKTILDSESAPGVVALMIAQKQGSYASKHAPVAFKYKVPIITYSTLITEEIVPWSKVGHNDDVHPKNEGHQLIARLLTEYYRLVLASVNEKEPEEFKVISRHEALTVCRYENADILFSDELEALSSEGFESKKVMKIMSDDNGWKTETAGTISFELEAGEIGVIWLQHNTDPSNKYADYDVYIDGEYKETLAGVAESWGDHLEYRSFILNDDMKKEKHTLELKPAEGTEGTEFEILGIAVSGC